MQYAIFRTFNGALNVVHSPVMHIIYAPHSNKSRFGPIKKIITHRNTHNIRIEIITYPNFCYGGEGECRIRQKKMLQKIWSFLSFASHNVMGGRPQRKYFKDN